jgi:pyruvate dehydrogenase E2 component (dihydrolipoamide acetyltransferase)
MATEFVVPELGENVEKADVGRLLVKVGDVIVKDQPVVELETDKATVEVPSSVAGKITDIKIKAGEKVKVGQVVLVVDANGSPAAAAPAAVPASAPASAPAEPLTISSPPGTWSRSNACSGWAPSSIT